jgi:hypothetical protein
MIITKKAIPRRTVLRGLGATLALPLLDGMIPAFTAVAKTAGKPINRFGVVYVPNGVIMKQYLPTIVGKDFEITPTLSPLEPYRDQMLVLSGLNCVPMAGRPGGSHAKSSTRFLTDVSPPTSQTVLDAGISMDQIAAKELGKQTQLASLQLGVESPDTAGACDVGFACAYTATISWAGAATPLPMENNPRAIFERLFGDGGGTDQKSRLNRIKQEKSVLDSITEEVARLQNSLAQSDRTKLSQYLEAVRDIERRIQKAEEQSGLELPELGQPAGIPASYEDHVKLMMDLQVLAYQTDLTRVSTFMMGREFSGVTYPQIGVPDAHHPISHHAGEAEKIAKMAKVNRYHASLFAYMVEKLKATQDGDGTLLDHVTMMYGYGMADSNTHSPYDIPLVLMGGGAGTLKGGRHLRYKDTPLANLHITLLDNLGVKTDRIGDSTGKLDERQLSIA